jgi:hypothetical protein
MFENAPTCSDCGQTAHLHPWHCPLDLHGEADWFKAACCMCEQEIPSGAPREADPFGNLYCSKDCLITGQQTLMVIIQEQREQIKADIQAVSTA